MPSNKTKDTILILVFLFVSMAAYSISSQKGQVKGTKEELTPDAKLVFLDVGQGDAALIEQGNVQILIDGGDGRDILNRLGEEMVLDRRIELVILSHPDEDHMGGLIKVLENYEVERILEPSIACDKDICERWESLKSEKKTPSTAAKLGQDIRFGDDIDIAVLYPFEDLSGKEFDNANEASLVLMADVEGRKYLLTGDTDKETEEALIASNISLDADVLKISHHGSKSATSAAFLEVVTPETAVISVGENSYGHTSEELLTRLRNMNVNILRTDEAGNIIF